MKQYLLLIFFLTTILSTNYSQNTNIKARLIDVNGKGLDNVDVYLPKLQRWTMSDSKGYFILRTIDSDSILILFKRLGLQTIRRKISSKNFNGRRFIMYENNLALKEVNVSASKPLDKIGSVSHISRKAIEHIQAISLRQVLDLIPGSILSNPDLSKPSQILIRQISTDDGSEDMNALGTSILINGAPVSNNANLQSSNSAIRGNISYFSSVVGRGNDLRKISTDNIESIEVIRGIAPVEYGDLTSGLILIETKLGKENLHFKYNKDPKNNSFSIGKGFSLAKRYGVLNTNLEYTKGTYNEADNYSYFERYTMNLSHRISFKNKLIFKNYITYISSKDNNSKNPISKDISLRQTTDYNINLTSTAKYYIDKAISKKIDYTLSINYGKQKSRDKSLNNTGIHIINMAKEDGEYKSKLLPKSYISDVRVYGAPFSLFYKINNHTLLNTGTFSHNLLLGNSFQLDKNFGRGRFFDPNYPPEGFENMGTRLRSYSSIPSMSQIAIYIQDKIEHKFNNSYLFRTSIGMRMDNFEAKKIFSGKWNLSPRINTSISFAKHFNIHAGYGINIKAIPLSYLYPDKAYFDLISIASVNSMATSEKENVFIITTKSINTQNKDLKLARNKKYEIGLDVNYKKNSFSINFYNEKTKNAYAHQLNTVFILYNKYKVVSANHGEEVKYTFDKQKIYLGLYSSPHNAFTIYNKGIEFSLNTKKISCIRSSFNISGSYMFTKSISSLATKLRETEYFPNSKMNRLFVFSSGDGSQTSKLVSTFKIIHHIPELKFIVSLTMQVSLFDKYKNIIASNKPEYYIDNLGNKKIISDSDEELKNYFDREKFIYKTNMPSLFVFNLNISKELKNDSRISFFINNMFMHNPIYKADNGGGIRLRNPRYYYGSEITIKI